MATKTVVCANNVQHDDMCIYQHTVQHDMCIHQCIHMSVHNMVCIYTMFVYTSVQHVYIPAV